MGFLRDPKQGAALAHLVAVLGAAGLLDGQTRGVLDGAAGLGAEAVVRQLGDHLTVADLGARVGVEAVADVVLALQVPELTGVGGFTHELAVLEGEAGGDDLHFAGIAGALAQAYGAAVLTHQTAFGQHLTGADGLVALHHRLGVGGQVVDVAAVHPQAAEALGLEGDVALAVGDLLGLDHVLVAHLAGQVADHVLGGLLHALLHGGAGRDLGQHHVGGGVRTGIHEQDRTGGDRQLLGLAAAAGLHREGEVGFSDLGLHTVGGAVGAHAGLAVEFDRTGHLGAHHAGFGGGHTTGVEGAHGELGAGLTDRLGGHDADGLTQVDQFVVGQGPAVALAAHRTGGFAGERRAHHHGLDAGGFDAGGGGGIDLAIAVDDHRTIGVEHGLGGQAAHQLGGETALVIGVDGDAPAGAAVVLPHDHVLGHIHQTAGQVAGVGGAQGGVHQTLAGAVGGDHVFGDRQTLTEIGADRKVDDFALGVGHQAAHAHQLTHLGHVPPGAGVGHHPDRVERVVVVEVLLDLFHQTLVGLGPGVDHLGVAFHLGDLTEAVALLGVGDLLLGLLQQAGLLTGDAQVVHGDRHGGLGGVVEAQVLQFVRHRGGGGGAVVLVGPRHQIPQLFLVDRAVAERRGRLAQGSGGAEHRCGGFLSSGLLAALLAGFLGGSGGHGCARTGMGLGGYEFGSQAAATASMIVLFITTRPTVVSR